MEEVKWLTIKIWPQNSTTGYLYITFSLPVVINYAAVHLVIQCIHISSIQLWASDTLSLSFFSWFCQGRGDYLKEGTYAAWADFGQQGLTANNPLLSNELWFSFLFFQTKKEYVKLLWTEHWSHITTKVSLLRSERATTLKKVSTKTKPFPIYLRVPPVRGRQKHSSILVWGSVQFPR